MKKRVKDEDSSEAQEVEIDIAGLLNKMQQQIIFLEKKIDTSIGQSQRPSERRPESSYRENSYRENSYRERSLHKAICADCAKECEVPFRPTGERPVYCKDCFAKRKGGSSFKERERGEPRREEPAKEHFYDRRPGARRKSGGGKKAPFQRRKRRPAH